MYSPTSGPSANTRVKASHTALPARSLYSAVNALQPSISGDDGGLGPDRGRAHRPAAVELGAQEADEPGLALALAGQDHAADVRQRRQRGQLAGAEVERVDVEVVGPSAGMRARASTRLVSVVVVPLPPMP